MRLIKVKSTLAFALVASLATGATALAAGNETGNTPSSAQITDSVVEQIRTLLTGDIVTRSIIAQNEKYGTLAGAEIEALDQQWRAERKADDKPLIAMTLSNPLSSYLTRLQADSFGLYTAIFVMDRNGLNVGQSAITGDFWQGDEAKFQKTFDVSPSAVFVDEPEDIEEHGIWITQVNLTLTDPETGDAIGAATFDVNLIELARRSALR